MCYTDSTTCNANTTTTTITTTTTCMCCTGSTTCTTNTNTTATSTLQLTGTTTCTTNTNTNTPTGPRPRYPDEAIPMVAAVGGIRQRWQRWQRWQCGQQRRDCALHHCLGRHHAVAEGKPRVSLRRGGGNEGRCVGWCVGEGRRRYHPCWGNGGHNGGRKPCSTNERGQYGAIRGERILGPLPGGHVHGARRTHHSGVQKDEAQATQPQGDVRSEFFILACLSPFFFFQYFNTVCPAVCPVSKYI
jgi:hypothetical protein